MDFRILGPLQVLNEERVLDVGGGKQRAVLAVLLLHPNEPVSSDRLIDELWPREPPPSATKIIHAHISRLRKALDSDGMLLTRGSAYELQIAPGQLDLDRFQLRLDEGRDALTAGDPERAADVLRGALALWRGPPLADFAYDSFAQDDIARLEELRLAALEERIDADLELGRHDVVVEELERLVSQHPLRDRLRSQLMLALYRSGRQSDALETYREGRRLLSEELGLEPSPALQQLERAILTHDDTLAAPPRRLAHKTHAKRRRRSLAGATLIAVAAAAALLALVLTSSRQAQGLAAVARDSVGVIDPGTNRIVDAIPVGSAPTSIASGRSGVWVVSEEDRTVTRIDPSRRTTLRTIAVGGSPVAVAVGSNATWLLIAGHTDADLGRGTPRVGRVDPRENDLVDSTPLGIGPVGLGSAAGIAAAADSVWVMNGDPPLPVSEIDAVNDRLKATFEVGDLSIGFNTGTVGGVRDASGIAFGAGSLWIGTAEGVVRIDAHSRAPAATIPLGGGIPTAIAVDRTGVWVTARPGFRCCPFKSVGHGTLTHVDPNTNSVIATIPIGGEPVGVAVGSDSVWVADAGKHRVVRVDPKTNAVVKRIDVGAAPRGITAGSGAIWISA